MSKRIIKKFRSPLAKYLELYRQKKISMLDIHKETNRDILSIRRYILNRGYELWDEDIVWDYIKKTKKNKKSRTSSRYFDWKEYKDAITFPRD